MRKNVNKITVCWDGSILFCTTIDSSLFNQLSKIRGKGVNSFTWYSLVRWFYFYKNKKDIINNNELRDWLLEEYNEFKIFLEKFAMEICEFQKENRRTWRKIIINDLKYNTNFENSSRKKLGGKSILSANVNKNYYCKIGNNLFYSVKDVVKKYNIPYYKVSNKIRYYGREMTEDEFLRGVDYVKSLKTTSVDFNVNDEHFESIRDFCKKYNVNEYSMHAKIHVARKIFRYSNFSKTEILEITAKAMLAKESLITYFVIDGIEFFNNNHFLKYCSKKHNLKVEALRSKYYRGWTLEEIYNNKRVDNNEIVKLG